MKQNEKIPKCSILLGYTAQLREYTVDIAQKLLFLGIKLTKKI